MLLSGFLIVGGLFAWLGVKKGLYAMFASLFCLMFAVYVGVLTTPRIVHLSEGMENDACYAAGCLLGMTLAVFVLLWSVAYFYFLREQGKYFSKKVTQIGGGVLGFLFGYILTSLMMMLTCITPFSRLELCRRDTMLRYSVPPVLKTCNFIAEYSLECFFGDSEKAIEFLITLGDAPEANSAETVPELDFRKNFF